VRVRVEEPPAAVGKVYMNAMFVYPQTACYLKRINKITLDKF
jgi:hypothetical protein